MAEPVLLADGQVPLALPGAASVAREVNLAIRDMAESLDAAARDVRPVSFLCECGCFASVELTVFGYDMAGGAWLDGHRPAETTSQGSSS